MKRLLMVAAAAALVAGTASAQPFGPGMMGGCPDAGGYGPGMMGGGYGGGMMGGGYGGGMMMGYGMGALDLSDAQRDKLLGIERAASQKQWAVMTRMHEQMLRLQELQITGKADDAALRQGYQAMADARKEMFDNALQTRHDIDAILTPEQRKQLQQGRPGARR